MVLRLLILLLLPTMSNAQTFQSNVFGGSVGLVLNTGTTINSIGLKLNGYYAQYFYQFNAGTELRFSLNSYGKRKNFFEARNGIGLVLLAGPKEHNPDFELSELHHNTNSLYGFGYNYMWYTDNAGTSQRSGGFGLHINNLSILIENDVFAGQSKDRFRTGALTLTYLYGSFKFAIGNVIWTGETAGSVWQKIPLDKCPSGFRILEDLSYGKTSHGVIYGGLTYSLPFGQACRFRIGIDSEQIRHSIQNRLIHDLIFLPSKVQRNTPHYPRLDCDGCPVFYKNDIRKNRLFLQLGANDTWSY